MNIAYSSLAFVLLLSLTACGGSDDGNSPSNSHASGGSPSSGGSSAGASSSGGGTGTGTGGSATGPSASGVEASAPADSLSDADLDAFCDWYVAQLANPANVEASCKGLGLLDGDTGTLEERRAACAQARDACPAQLEASRTAFRSTCPTYYGTNCTATVSEIESCALDLVALNVSAGEAVPACADATEADFETPPERPTLSPSSSCVAVNLKCKGP